MPIGIKSNKPVLLFEVVKEPPCDPTMIYSNTADKAKIILRKKYHEILNEVERQFVDALSKIDRMEG